MVGGRQAADIVFAELVVGFERIIDSVIELVVGFIGKLVSLVIELVIELEHFIELLLELGIIVEQLIVEQLVVIELRIIFVVAPLVFVIQLRPERLRRAAL